MRCVPRLIFLCWIAGTATAVAEEPAGPIIRMAFEENEAIPGQPIVMRVTLLAPTWMPKAPIFPSFEIPNIIIRLPERASGPTSETVDGETWSGVTRAYRLYPMTIGRFQIAPEPVIVTYADPETSEPITVELQTEGIEFEGVAPEGAQDLDPFIAAEELTLEQTIEGETADLEPGDTVSHQIKARIKGTSPIFLPALIPPAATGGIAIYPKEPVVTESEDRGVLSGERVEHVVYVGEAGGRYTSPPISLRWFNLNTNEVETADLPGFDIVVQGKPPPPLSEFDWRSLASWIAGGFLVIALIGALLRRLWPFINAWRTRRREAYLGSEAFAFAEAQKALRARQFNDSIQAVDRWRSRLPMQRGQDDSQLSEALARLGAMFYRDHSSPPTDQPWSEALQALRAARRECMTASARVNDALPPLNPH